MTRNMVKEWIRDVRENKEYGTMFLGSFAKDYGGHASKFISNTPRPLRLFLK